MAAKKKKKTTRKRGPKRNAKGRYVSTGRSKRATGARAKRRSALRSRVAAKKRPAKKRAAKKRSPFATIEALARRASAARLAGRMAVATSLDRMLDAAVTKAERAGKGDAAFAAEERGRARASRSR
jgi:hypothetical protein